MAALFELEMAPLAAEEEAATGIEAAQREQQQKFQLQAQQQQQVVQQRFSEFGAELEDYDPNQTFVELQSGFDPKQVGRNMQLNWE